MVRRIAQSSSMNLKDRLPIELHDAGVHFGWRPLPSPGGAHRYCRPQEEEGQRQGQEYIESPGVEKVKRLLRTDAEAVSVRWEMGHGFSAKRDELREILNDISSSSDEDEGGLRREDEDLNIMDMEEDLVRQLQDKLNESSDGGRDEADRNNLIVMEYQVQVDCVKAKLKKTRAREKQQEDLIMKVENQALKLSARLAEFSIFHHYYPSHRKRSRASDWHSKWPFCQNRFQALLSEIIHQEESEMEQLAFLLQEQLDSLIEM
ncbi:hypothetical protein J4Q44_G00303600 [Coregonus suidteri]|uniref:Uncharacterized protein n=1 Tax=Coregonus suidteri TaxID=861788 RepID=A0AAN8QBJ8_9TELE